MKNLFVALALALLFIPGPSLFAQVNASISFQSSFGDSLIENSYGITRMGDSYYTVGYSLYSGVADFMVSRIDSFGNLEWTKTYGGSTGDFGHSIDVTANGDIVTAGWGKSFGAGDDDLLFIRMDQNGTPQTTKSYGGTGIDRARCIREIPGGDLIHAGHTNSFGAGLNDILLVRTTSLGDTIWAKTYGVFGNDNAWWVEPVSTGGFIVTGNTGVGAGFLNLFLLRVDNNGDTLWARSYGSASGIVTGYCVKEANSGGFVVTGYTSAFGNGGDDIFVMRTDGFGNITWANAYGDLEDEEASGIVELDTTGNFIIVGKTQSFTNYIYDESAYLLEVNGADGEINWSGFLGDSITDEFSAVASGHPHGFVAIGNGSYSGPNRDILVHKGSVDTVSSCSTFPALTSRVSVNPVMSPAQFSVSDAPLVLTSQNISGIDHSIEDTVWCLVDMLVNGLDGASELQLEIYPNPSSGDIHFRSSDLAGRKCELEIYSYLGQLEHRQSILLNNSGSYSLDLRTLNEGAYLLMIKCGESMLRQKVILKR